MFTARVPTFFPVDDRCFSVRLKFMNTPFVIISSLVVSLPVRVIVIARS
jgi:hypothetical protein